MVQADTIDIGLLDAFLQAELVAHRRDTATDRTGSHGDKNAFVLAKLLQHFHVVVITAAAFDEADLLPYVLRGTEEIDLATEVMGLKLDVPFFLSPTALQRLFHHQGERASAAAAATNNAGNSSIASGTSDSGMWMPLSGAERTRRLATGRPNCWIG